MVLYCTESPTGTAVKGGSLHAEEAGLKVSRWRAYWALGPFLPKPTTAKKGRGGVGGCTLRNEFAVNQWPPCSSLLAHMQSRPCSHRESSQAR